MNKKISILIPMFNREEFIYESVMSIINQTYKNLDIIIYDDGSTDESVNIIKKLMETDKRIRLIKGKENKGVGYARNELIKACNTEYAVWHDSDDISHSNRIYLQSQIKGKKLVFTNWVWLHKVREEWVKRLKNSDSQAFATLLFPVDKKIQFDPNKKLGGEDWEWINKMLKKYQKITIEEILYYVRFHHDRIGTWKKKTKLNKRFPKKLLAKLSYKELIEYYKRHYE
jgi:glycosyltransferase involved in cell wall biosynthesis